MVYEYDKGCVITHPLRIGFLESNLIDGSSYVS